MQLEEARAWFARAADVGLTDAQVALAEMTLHGRGGPASTTVALDLFEKAAAKGHSGAMFALGVIYTGGHDIPTNQRTAQNWFRAAAERGHGRRNSCSAVISAVHSGRVNSKEARIWLEPAAAQGVAEAESDLAGLTLRMQR